MLLFIADGKNLCERQTGFQYISCYCLSFTQFIYSVRQAYFTTSHVTVYQKAIWFGIPQSVFQYISCYCLSGIRVLMPDRILNFNTSHVTVYRYVSSAPSKSPIYFNTSHVTVYRISLSITITGNVFQYISCYCLSTVPRKALFLLINFNTSHVTVYPRLPVLPLPAAVHFNTSHVTVYPRLPVLPLPAAVHFNTSHVTVYLFGTILAPFYLHYFNTSHVTVYPISIRYSRNFSFISIHLMLLFIIFSISLRSVRLQFQYISCYCLSRKCGVCDSLDFPISIHLMLLFIRFGRCLASCGK